LQDPYRSTVCPGTRSKRLDCETTSRYSIHQRNALDSTIHHHNRRVLPYFNWQKLREATPPSIPFPSYIKELTAFVFLADDCFFPHSSRTVAILRDPPRQRGHSRAIVDSLAPGIVGARLGLFSLSPSLHPCCCSVATFDIRFLSTEPSSL